MKTDLQGWTRAIFKAVGIGLVVYAVATIVSNVPILISLLETDFDYLQLSYYLPYLVYLTLGLALWLRPAPIVNTVVSDSQSVNAHELEVLAFAVIGVASIVIGLSALASDIVSYYNLSALDVGRQVDKRIQLKSEVAGHLVLIIAGLMLALRGRGIARTIETIRNAD